LYEIAGLPKLRAGMSSLASSGTGGAGGAGAARLSALAADVETALRDAVAETEPAAIPSWQRVLDATHEYTLRPGKRLRPMLVLAGFECATGATRFPPELLRFAAGVELLHTFLLIHDDVADGATLRRGGPALHQTLAPGRRGEDQAVVVGDYLFARSLEVMLTCGSPRAAAATRYYLAVCRETAQGQFLDLDLTGAPLPDVTPFLALRVAMLKTARYGFVAPLVAGAMLGDGDLALERRLERIGRAVGVAYQLQDDLLGLFGDARLTGKAGDADFAERKVTFPVVAAYRRASAEGRRTLEALWAASDQGAEAAARARDLIERAGGRLTTERAVTRARAAAMRATGTLAHAPLLDALVRAVGRRAR